MRYSMVLLCINRFFNQIPIGRSSLKFEPADRFEASKHSNSTSFVEYTDINLENEIN